MSAWLWVFKTENVWVTVEVVGYDSEDGMKGQGGIEGQGFRC